MGMGECVILMYMCVQIEVVNDKIGMAYSGMGPDFRYRHSYMSPPSPPYPQCVVPYFWQCCSYVMHLVLRFVIPPSSTCQQFYPIPQVYHTPIS